MMISTGHRLNIEMTELIIALNVIERQVHERTSAAHSLELNISQCIKMNIT